MQHSGLLEGKIKKCLHKLVTKETSFVAKIAAAVVQAKRRVMVNDRTLVEDALPRKHNARCGSGLQRLRQFNGSPKFNAAHFHRYISHIFTFPPLNLAQVSVLFSNDPAFYFARRKSRLTTRAL